MRLVVAEAAEVAAAAASLLPLFGPAVGCSDHRRQHEEQWPMCGGFGHR